MKNLPGWATQTNFCAEKKMTDLAPPLSLKVAPLFSTTFLFFLTCCHPASRWLRYTGCLLSFCLKESLSPADLVSLRSVEQSGKNECRTNKWRWRENRPPVYEIQAGGGGGRQVKVNGKAVSLTKNGVTLVYVQKNLEKPSSDILLPKQDNRYNWSIYWPHVWHSFS